MFSPSMLRLGPLLLALMASVSWAQTTTAPDAVRPDPARNSDGYYSIVGKGYADIPAVPPPILPQDLERWSWMMALSESQQKFFQQLYEAYIIAEQKLHMQHVQPLWDRSSEILATGRMEYNVSLAEAYAHLLEVNRKAAVHRLAAIENLLFEQLVPILTDEQLAKFQCVRAQRLRARQNPTYSDYPGGHLDLTLPLFAFHKGGWT